MAVTKEFKPLEMHDRRKKNNPFKKQMLPHFPAAIISFAQ